MQGEVQAVTKVYDILKWLIPQMSRFPRSHKFTLGDRITNLGLDVLMLLVEANYTRGKTELLQQANQKLEQLRYLLRLCKDLELFSLKRYGHISRQINESAPRSPGNVPVLGFSTWPKIKPVPCRLVGDERWPGTFEDRILM